MMRIAGPLPGQPLNSHKHAAEQPSSSGPVEMSESAGSGCGTLLLSILTTLKSLFSKI